MGMYLRAKFEVCSIILTRFRRGVILPYLQPPPPTPQNEPLKSPPRLGLKKFSWKYIDLSGIA